jgi:hypothetical protein
MEMNKIAGLLVIALVLFSGCKKYLDIKSDSTLIIPSTLADLQQLLDDANTMNYSTAVYGSASADDYFLEDRTYLSRNVFQQHVYRWEPYEYRYINDWSLAYRAVYNSNTCLERMGSTVPDANEQLQWSNVKGSALFYRAYYFLELSWLFAKAYDEQTAASDPGIVLRMGTDFNVPSSRASVKDCYRQVISDAMEAVLYLPEQQEHTTRPSRAAAYGLLSRVYLSMRQYDSAGYYAGKALEIKSSLMDYNDPAQVDANGFYPIQRKNAETIFYSTMNVFLYLSHPLAGNARTDTLLYAAYDSNDLRKTVFFTATGKYQRFKGNYAGDFALFSGIATDELLLIRAECAARSGATASALADINRLLEKRMRTGSFVPVTETSTGLLLGIILKERQKELLFRGSLRWMDIKRLNKENGGILLQRTIQGENFTLPPNDKRYALPLPTDVIETSGMEQNEY